MIQWLLAGGEAVYVISHRHAQSWLFTTATCNFSPSSPQNNNAIIVRLTFEQISHAAQASYHRNGTQRAQKNTPSCWLHIIKQEETFLVCVKKEKTSFEWPCSSPVLSETARIKVDGHNNVTGRQLLNDSDTRTLYSSSQALNKASNNHS